MIRDRCHLPRVCVLYFTARGTAAHMCSRLSPPLVFVRSRERVHLSDATLDVHSVSIPVRSGRARVGLEHDQNVVRGRATARVFLYLFVCSKRNWQLIQKNPAIHTGCSSVHFTPTAEGTRQLGSHRAVLVLCEQYHAHLRELDAPS